MFPQEALRMLFLRNGDFFFWGGESPPQQGEKLQSKLCISDCIELQLHSLYENKFSHSFA